MGWPGSPAKLELNSCASRGMLGENKQVENRTEQTACTPSLEGIIFPLFRFAFLGDTVSHKTGRRGKKAGEESRGERAWELARSLRFQMWLRVRGCGSIAEEEVTGRGEEI